MSKYLFFPSGHFDFISIRFERLTVVHFHNNNKNDSHAFWHSEKLTATVFITLAHTKYYIFDLMVNERFFVVIENPTQLNLNVRIQHQRNFYSKKKRVNGKLNARRRYYIFARKLHYDEY